MATKNIVPRYDAEGYIGTAAKRWIGGFFRNFVDTYMLSNGPLVAVTVDQLVEAVEGIVNKTVEVAPSITESVDVIDLNQTKTAKWLVSIESPTGLWSFELMARARGLNVVDTEYARVGDAVDFEYIVASDGSYMTLAVKNNELSPITVRFRRYGV
jgi:hypothetical protein